MRREIKEMASREYANPREGRRHLAGAFRALVKAHNVTNFPVDPRQEGEEYTPEILLTACETDAVGFITC